MHNLMGSLEILSDYEVEKKPVPFTAELKQLYQQRFLELIEATGLTPFAYDFVGSSEINGEIGSDVDILLYVSPDTKFDMELLNRASDNDLFFTGCYTIEEGEQKENDKVEKNLSTNFLSFKYEGYSYPFSTFPLNIILTKSIDDYRKFVFARNICKRIQEHPIYSIKLSKAQRVCIHEIIRNDYQPNVGVKECFGLLQV